MLKFLQVKTFFLLVSVITSNIHNYVQKCDCGTNGFTIEDLAVDWVSNKLYWVDAVWARVEVIDLLTLDRAVVLRTGAYTSPRAIAVEPINR